MEKKHLLTVFLLALYLVVFTAHKMIDVHEINLIQLS